MNLACQQRHIYILTYLSSFKVQYLLFNNIYYFYKNVRILSLKKNVHKYYYIQRMSPFAKKSWFCRISSQIMFIGMQHVKGMLNCVLMSLGVVVLKRYQILRCIISKKISNQLIKTFYRFNCIVIDLYIYIYIYIYIYSLGTI